MANKRSALASSTLTQNFEHPLKISKGGHITRFSYGPDRSRYKREDKADNGVTTTTLYLGNVERIYTEGESTVTWRRNIAGAVYTVTTDLNNNVQSTDKAFVFTDHLGSTMDELGLIHMNGRVYDPKLARFLQADPFIQAASNTQSYNRYSYVWNNPLNATDPSGYLSLKSLWDEIRPYVGAIVAVVATVICWGWCTAPAYMLIGGASGAVGAAANGGNIVLGTLLGALSGAAAGTGNLWAMAAAGGYSAWASGGDFGRGFVAAGIGGMVAGLNLQGMDGFVAAAVAGGIATEITGGKFANGAATAAFMWALRAGVNKVAGGVEEVGGSQTKQKGRVNESLRDNIRTDENGNLVLDITVGAEAGQEAQRDLLVNEISGKWEGKGGCNFFGFGCDSSQSESLTVNATAVDGAGDITVYSRATMQSLASDPGQWDSPSFCRWACATTGGNRMHINSMSMSGDKYLHEVFHNFGLSHSRGLMGTNGGSLTAENVNSLRALYGL